MSDTITDLRADLFATLRAIKDGSIDIDRAKAINDTAQVIINSAKVEVDYARATGGEPASGFMEADTTPRIGDKRRTATGEIVTTPTGVVHRMK